MFKAIYLFLAILLLLSICPLRAQKTIVPTWETTLTTTPSATFSDVCRQGGDNWICGYSTTSQIHHAMILKRRANDIYQFPWTAQIEPPLFIRPVGRSMNDLVLFTSSNYDSPDVGTGPPCMVKLHYDSKFNTLTATTKYGIYWLADGFIEKVALGNGHFFIAGTWDMDEDMKMGVIDIYNATLTRTDWFYTPNTGLTIGATHYDGFEFYDACPAGDKIVVLARAYTSPAEYQWVFAEYVIFEYSADGVFQSATVPHVQGVKIRPLSIVQNEFGGYALLSRELSDSQRILLQAFQNSGAELWTHYYPEIGKGVWEMRRDMDGANQIGYIIYGAQESRGWLLRLDTKGGIVCGGLVASPGADNFVAVVNPDLAAYAAVGSNNGYAWYGEFQLPCAPNRVSGSKIESAPDIFTLYAMPNPFNQSTRILFELPIDERIMISVIDINGRTVCHLLEKHLKAGSHSIVWDGSTDNRTMVPTGVYIIRIASANFSKEVKVSLLR
ncbi:T9SS type A sorting domain-containing protein [candidate division KSB1 bacterium]|nr:T9SS type A sorting domain-containing protein [candidate division KSB1 bacterium]